MIYTVLANNEDHDELPGPEKLACTEYARRYWNGDTCPHNHYARMRECLVSMAVVIAELEDYFEE